MSELPSGWDSVNLFEICRPRQWKTISTRDLLPYGYVVYGANGEIGFYSEYTHENPTVMITCRGATCGNIHISKPFSYINGNAMALDDLNESISGLRYVNYFLRSRGFEDVISGSAQPQITGEGLRKVSIPIAPLPEQKRIADKLDAVLARVDACRDRLDRIPAILKRFRQSILAAATSGKLTEEWRAEHVARMQPQAESGITARDSAQSHYVVTIAPDSATLHPGYEAALQSSVWQVGTLANLLIGKPRNGYSPRAVEYKTSVKSLTLTATTSGQFKGEHFKYIDEEISPDSYLWLQPGDILIQRANTLESVGISAVFDGPPSTYIYPDLMMKAKANELVKPKFLHYLLLSEPVRRHFRDNATGTAGNMPKINQPTVLSAPVTWPSLKEQTEIVRRVESLFAYADRLEARHQAARAQVEKLTPATLAKAFRGELVPQDANDEPASVLLERIRAQRDEQAVKKPKRT